MIHSTANPLSTICAERNGQRRSVDGAIVFNKVPCHLQVTCQRNLGPGRNTEGAVNKESFALLQAQSPHSGSLHCEPLHKLPPYLKKAKLGKNKFEPEGGIR